MSFETVFRDFRATPPPWFAQPWPCADHPSKAASSAHAAKRCDWHGPLSGGEIPYAKCVDFAAMQGKTITLPKNVTRIAADGLSFCVPPTPTTGSGNADIVFVYDNSGSMTRGRHVRQFGRQGHQLLFPGQQQLQG